MLLPTSNSNRIERGEEGNSPYPMLTIEAEQEIEASRFFLGILPDYHHSGKGMQLLFTVSQVNSMQSPVLSNGKYMIQNAMT